MYICISINPYTYTHIHIYIYIQVNCSLIRHHKGRRFILTAGRWSWKLKSAKECVTTHLPNGLAPKMDGAAASDR